MTTITSADRQAWADKLEKAIAVGAQSIQLDGQTITYRSLDDMRRILADLQAQVTAGAPTLPTVYAAPIKTAPGF